MNRKQFLATLIGVPVAVKAVASEEKIVHWTDNVAKKYNIVEECEKIRREAEQLNPKYNYPMFVGNFPDPTTGKIVKIYPDPNSIFS
jgi:hypothetical protein